MDLATSYLKNLTETYFEKIAQMTGDELLEYNKTVMDIKAKPIGLGFKNVVAWNMEVKKAGLKFRIEQRRGYKLLTYFR